MPSGGCPGSLGDTDLFWAAVSRAVRSPTPFDTDVVEWLGTDTFLTGNPNFLPEQVTAYEAGLSRPMVRPGSRFPSSLFENVYDDLRSIETTPGHLHAAALGQHASKAMLWPGGLGQLAGDRLVAALAPASPSSMRICFEPGASKLLGSVPGGRRSASPGLAALLDESGRRRQFRRRFPLCRRAARSQGPEYVELNARLGWKVSDTTGAVAVRLQSAARPASGICPAAPKSAAASISKPDGGSDEAPAVFFWPLAAGACCRDRCQAAAVAWNMRSRPPICPNSFPSSPGRTAPLPRRRALHHLPSGPGSASAASWIRPPPACAPATTPVQVRHLAAPDPSANCQLIFLPAEATRRRRRERWTPCGAQPGGDRDRFRPAVHGMISFVIEDNHVRFDIDDAMAARRRPCHQLQAAGPGPCRQDAGPAMRPALLSGSKRNWSPMVAGALAAAAVLLAAGVLMAVYQEQLYSAQQARSVREQAADPGGQRHRRGRLRRPEGGAGICRRAAASIRNCRPPASMAATAA